MRIGFIGGGNMASALIGGVIHSHLATPDEILVSDILPQKRELLKREFSVRTADTSLEVVQQCPVIILAVKPQNLQALAASLKNTFTPEQILISILAGKSRAAILEALGSPLRLVRVMPNLPALVGAGVSAIAEMPDDQDAQSVTQSIFETVGRVAILPESLMDPVTALSGSGPGFVYYLMEAFVQTGIELGFTEQQALQLTLETFLGSCRLLLERSTQPEALRQQVTSPGGTTAAGISEFDSCGLKDVIRRGLVAANQRAKELSNPDTK